MTHVKLMGELGEKFGTDWHMATSSFRDIFKLIDCQTEGFKQYILECNEKGLDFDILNGKDLLEDGYSVMLEKPEDIVVITPRAAGAGSLSDAFKVIAGALLIIYGPELYRKECLQKVLKLKQLLTADALVAGGEGIEAAIAAEKAVATAQENRSSSTMGDINTWCRTRNVRGCWIYDARKSFRSRRQLSL